MSGCMGGLYQFLRNDKLYYFPLAVIEIFPGVSVPLDDEGGACGVVLKMEVFWKLAHHACEAECEVTDAWVVSYEDEGIVLLVNGVNGV